MEMEFQCEQCGVEIGKAGVCSRCRKRWYDWVDYVKELEIEEKQKEEIRLKKDENL
jgi:hypothetical protein